MSQPHPLDELSKGEQRRLYLHLREAQDRLDRARDVLDDAGVIDDWGGGYGFVHGFTDGQAQIDGAYTVAARRYREGDDDD
jgi:hypothetical protein